MSSNSNSKSKRSFKSISSNPSSSSNNISADDKSKKKKTAQKTLGMAWGPNSRSGFSNSPFSDFGSYMVVKNQKLHEQFDAAASSSTHCGTRSGKSIFCGVSIFVDGYTIPSSQELRGYMLKYGGRFENYFSRHRVTHIICSNLPDSKIKNLRAFSGGLPVVKPTWVLDSVAADKLLSWVPYQLDQLAAENDNQPKLSAFFTLKSSRVSEIADRLVNGQAICENDITSLDKVDSSLSEANSILQLTDRCSVEPEDLLPTDNENDIGEEPACSVESTCGIEGVEMIDTSPLDGRNSGCKPTSSTFEPSVSLCNNNLGTHNNEASSSKTEFPPNQRHSTLADPNFVENYFKNSRLHFIGTWRNRYRNRFPSSSNRFKYKSHSLDTAAANQKSAIIHIDMDCFFVSVVIRNHADLLDKPVAVCHSDNARGAAEISSANYPARDYGVKAGMFVKDARTRCPQLVIVPYDFGAYEKVADQFYEILHKHCDKVQAVSCDEAFLDVSESEVDDPQLLASTIRQEIIDTTGCTASVGIAGNMLMARLATKTAKPNGQCYIPPEKVDGYLCSLPVKALPGIGHVLEEKLKKRQIETCGQLRMFTKESLQKDFGMKTGEMLWNYSRGIDNRLVGVIQESRSIGAEVNWGVRFRDLNDTQHFLKNLCKEVALRLQGCRVQGRSFTLKIKKRRHDAGEPVKYMGCGECVNLSHTTTIPMATNDVDVLQRLATQLFGYFNLDVKDVRGVGLQVSKLEGADDGKHFQKRNSIVSWIVSSSVKARDQENVRVVPNHDNADTRRLSNGEAQVLPCSDTAEPSAPGGAGFSSSVSDVSQTATLPPLHDLDVAVIESLPPEVVSEINDMYGGKLLGFISEYKGKVINANIMHGAPLTSGGDIGVAADETESLRAHLVASNTITGANEMDFKNKDIVLESSLDSSVIERCNQELQCDESSVHVMSGSVSQKNLMPTSLSQVDCSVLQQLPEELRKDIIELLPPHRTPEVVKGSSSNVIDNQAEFGESENDLWIGSPPLWVDKFETSNCCMLNKFAKMYRFGTGGCLSFVLQRMISEIHLPLGMGIEGLDNAVNCLSELFKQYVELKVATDIEEIHLCICLLRRLTGRSEVFSQVYNIILPHLQISVGDKYGGSLDIPVCE
ncbi:hypothetical protein ACJIZ3_015547 [Penstemon smallii]|uniref:DNA repair protein REV1 n=1 Tax=Penstemon smallii TaxID=265156 RepID=A0ABD3RMT6_9LAMI